MDCPDVQLAISAELDGETVPDELRAEADAHCDSCSECAGFRREFQALSAIEPANPPADLVTRTLAAVRDAAAADVRAAQKAQDTTVVLATPPSARSERRRTWLWAASAATLVAAAVLIFAIVRLTGAPGGTRTDLVVGTSEAPKAAAPAQAPVPTNAPPYVTLGQFVYRVGGAIQVSASQLVPAGTIVSSMGRNDTPRTLQAFTLSGEPGALVVLQADGSYVTCLWVLREFHGVSYQLVSGTPIQEFGTWPDLPQSIPKPAAPDGSPTLTSVGTDSVGVTVYRSLSDSIETGFGVPPGTPPSDPASGNPGWTWWRPVTR